jgi:luciferase family oxidoreductase group 1
MTAPPIMPLSFLDLCQIEAGSNSGVALRNSTELAQRAEQLGYTRYWFAEHHNSIGLASGSPEVMIAHVAGQTQRIHVGAGGVMLPNHPPLRIAEAFRVLEALHPGRIDLGLGRAPGTDTLTAYALRRSEEALRVDQYPELLAELLALESGGFADEHPFRRIKITPADVPLPPLWLLGSSAFSAQVAAELGLAFSFAAHINGGVAVPVMRMYRERFTPSQYRETPHAILAVHVVVGESAEQAQELMRIVEIGMASLAAGRPYQMPTLEEALRTELSPLDRERARTMLQNVIVGDPPTVAARVRDFARETQADEVMLTTSLPNLRDRLRTLERMAEVWGLTPGITPYPEGDTSTLSA